MSSRNVTLGALLGALAAVIPLAFGFLRVTIPPFTATLASHVPVMLAMFVSPAVAFAAGLGSTVGFLLATSLWYVAARAAVHMVWGVLGAYLYRRGMRPWAVLSVILPLHMLGEALVVLPFGFDLYKAFIVVGIGTGLHHLVDMTITLAVLGALVRLGVPLARRPA
ncbi:MAG: ECF transporter S component [Firmicutes bacterium]|nr:ECF transporter S component [Bacillota bacterium]